MKIFLIYLIFLISSFTVNLFMPEFKHFFIPAILIGLSFAFSPKINFRFKKSDLILSMKISLLILAPFALLTYLYYGKFQPPTFSTILYLLFGVAVSEEIFFRGVIQEKLGNNWKALIITSILFSLAHLPNFLFYNNFFSLATFFPSLIMGWLYMKTSNILPSIIFHFLSNCVAISWGVAESIYCVAISWGVAESIKFPKIADGKLYIGLFCVFSCHSDPERSEGEESPPFFFFLFKACN